jgi:hypothetical protein
MVKTEYDYQTKRISHRIQRKAIAGHIRNLDSARVLCLPGAEAREIIEVYDPLGIKRKNIIGVERDGEAYEQLKKADLGIELYRGELHEFLRDFSGQLDIASLDFTQTPNAETLLPVLYLTTREILSGNSVLSTNFYASRISDFITHSLPIIKDRKIGYEKFGRLIKSFDHTSTVTGRNKQLKNYVSNLKDLKDEGITNFILLAINENYDLIARLIREGGYEVDDPKNFKRASEVEPTIHYHNKEACRKFLVPHKNPMAVANFVSEFHQKRKRPLIEDLIRFSYVSNDNSLMMSDIFLISDFSRLFEKAKKYYKGNAKDSNGREFYDMEFEKLSFRKSVERFGELIGNYLHATQKSDGFLSHKGLPIRVDITPREDLDQETAVKLIKSGWTYEKIEDKFRNVTPARIAAYKAHMTMGTYEKKKEEVVVSESKAETSPALVKTGIMYFDSESNRSKKNFAKINFGPNQVIQTSLLNGNAQTQGVLADRKYGLYVINTNDPKAEKAVEELALKFCESNRYLNLFLIGDINAFDHIISTARDLGAKVNVKGHSTKDGHIQSNKPLSLENMIA